jgi:Subtilase family
MMVARMPNRRYAFFRDDQIMLLVTHPEVGIKANQLDNLSKIINPHLEQHHATIDWHDSRIFSFPRPTGYELQQQANIIEELKKDFEERKNYGDEQRQFNPADFESQLFTDEKDQFKQGFSLIAGNIIFDSSAQQAEFDPRKLIQVIRGLRESFKSFSDEQLTVKSVSPNWLMGNSSQGGTIGGPGGIPKPFKGKNGIDETQYGLSIKEKLQNLGIYSSGQNVDVAILDTAPCPHDLVIAHKEGKDNPLIQTLLGPNGKLRVYWATYDQLLRMYNTSLNSHDYRMSDHGLFIAGIIHSIVPDATIHLIEVLNPWGVGDLQSLADGFKTVLHDIYKPDDPLQAGRKLVVNCSLMLQLPIDDDQCYADESKDEAKDKEPPDDVDDVNFEQEVLQLVKENTDVVFEINELCKRLFGVGRQVVAAAGNDWENGKARRRRRGAPDEARTKAPAARYPAAFASVIGVGALPKSSRIGPNRHKASTYSNLGDKPAGDGIMTLGGEEGEARGLLGLYVSDKFPRRSNPNNKNEITMFERRDNLDPTKTEINHWAWWSGTSFATPIVTGTIAALLGTVDNTQRAVRALYGPAISQAGTDAGEDVMEVIQG